MDVKEKDEETTSLNHNKNGDLQLLEVEDEEEAWGTLEELLLVCAVNRHGTNCWDFVSEELHKRIKHSWKDVVLEDSSSFSSRNCCRKYVHLKRRFCYDDVGDNGDGDGDGDGGGDVDGGGEGEGEQRLLRMVDELRKRRVEELKRQVHNHDASIVSLQLKVKRLEEERERRKVKDEGDEEDTVLSDLRNKTKENVRITGETPDEPVEKVITGDSTENRSCNESNSTKYKCEEEPDLVRSEYNHNNQNNWKKNEPIGDSKVSRLVELGESLSDSRKESTKQQSSDVQSSASLWKKKRRRFRGGDNSGDELEAEELSSANKRINAKSQPLIRFFDTLRSHKHGSVFNRRLPSQETEKYRNVVRQHLDLDTVQSKLDKGIYCDCHPKFYRDLLLIFTNAVLFYRKSSAEHIAARELRKLVIDEMNQKMRKPKIQQRKPDLKPQHLEPVVKKPRSSTTMVVCRKRSVTSMQALSDSMKKEDDANNTSNTNIKINIIKMENGREEKVKPDLLQKKVNGSSGSNNNSSLSSKEKESKREDGDASLKKLLMQERSSLGSGGLRLSNNNGKKIISKDSGKREKNSSVNKELSSEGGETQGGERKQEKGTPTLLLKKQGVANFLKRMKQNSPSSQEKTKIDDFSEEKDEEEEAKKRRREKTRSTNNGNGKKTSGNSRKNAKESIIRRSSSRGGDKEAVASRMGRPPKRKAAMMSGSTPELGKGGRSGGRDNGEKFKKKPRR